jgi:hypothetical protein
MLLKLGNFLFHHRFGDTRDGVVEWLLTTYGRSVVLRIDNGIPSQLNS